MKIIILSTIIFLIFSVSASALTRQDVQDYDETTKIGCFSKQPISDKADVYFICKSRHSKEIAFQAVMYRVKLKCNSDWLNMLFKLPPDVPTETGLYGVQMEASCNAKKP